MKYAAMTLLHLLCMGRAASADEALLQGNAVGETAAGEEVTDSEPASKAPSPTPDEGVDAKRPEDSDTVADAGDKKNADDKAADDGESLDPNRTEWSILPVFGGNSDIGAMFGLGLILAKFSEDRDPYKWRLDTNATAAVGKGGITMQNYRVNINMPQFLGSRARLIGSVVYQQLMDKGYYGVGNASKYVPSDAQDRYTYDYKMPEVWAYTEVMLTKTLDFLGGFRFRYSIIDTAPGSRLDEDRNYLDANGDPVLPGTDNHGELVFAVGASYDTRDHETAPTKGMYHQFSTRASAGPMTGTDYNWGGSTLILRFYYSFLGEYLTFGTRLMGDLMYGTPPFYEMALAGAFPYFSAIGGSFAIRGVPDGRYHGGIKILGNFEVRTVLIRFKLKSHRFKLGLAAFFDTGRVWTGWKSYPQLDGTGMGMKFGTGGGLRAQWGETFMARIDIAWSPDANPIGGYFAVGHMF